MLKIVTVILAFALTACGGDETPKIDPVIPDVDPNNPGVPVVTPGTSRKIQFSGSIAGFDLNSGTVSLYDFSSGRQGTRVGTATISNSNSYTISATVTSTDGVVLACLDSGSYTEPATESVIAIMQLQSICAVKTFATGSFYSVNVNPWTHYGSAYFNYLLSLGGTSKSSAVSANTKIKEVFNFDPQSLTHASLSSSSDLFSDSGKAALLQLAVSAQTLGYAEEAGLTAHSIGYSSLDFHATAHRDITSDGKLDGQGRTYSGAPIVNLGMGTTLFTGATYTLDSAVNAVTYIGSDKNTSTIVVGDVIDSQQDFATNTDSFLGSNIADLVAGGLDSEAPVVTTNIANSQTLTGSHTITASATDFIGVESISLFIDNALQATNQSSELSYAYDTTNDSDGSKVVKIVAVDLLGNSSETLIAVSVDNPTFTIDWASSELVNTASHTIAGRIESESSQITSATINGQALTLDGSGNFTFNAILGEGMNTYIVRVTDEFAVSEVILAKIELDTVLPVNAQATYSNSVYYKEGGSEPVLSLQRFPETTHSLYIDQFHKSLNGAASDIATLNSLKQPFIEFHASDNLSEQDELSISYKYYQDNVLKHTRAIQYFSIENGKFHVPLASDWLINDWNLFTGTHKITTTVTDQAGNDKELDFEFKVHYSEPAITVDTDLVFGAKESTLSVVSTDFIGFDNVVFEVNGQTYTANSITDPNFTFDLTGMPHSNSYGYVKAYKDGVLTFSERVDFAIDTTPPVISTANEHRVGADLLLEGNISDGESEIDSVRVGEQYATYNPFDNTFDINITGLEDGIHNLEINGTNSVGLTATKSVTAHVDTQLPRFSYYYPSTGYLYDVRRQDVPNTPPTTRQFSQMGGSESFYMTPENTQLNGTPITVDALKAGGYVFINAQFVDRWSAGAETEMGDLTITYDYRVGDDLAWIFEGRVAPNNNGILILPLTTEYFGNELLQTDRLVLHDLRIWVHDKSGNYIVKSFQFSVAYDANSTY